MYSNNSTLSHYSGDYQKIEEDKENIQPLSFLQFCEINKNTGLNTITQRLSYTLSQIRETENSLYETLQIESDEQRKQQIRMRLIKLQMLQEIAQFKADTKSNITMIQLQLREIQAYIHNQLL